MYAMGLGYKFYGSAPIIHANKQRQNIKPSETDVLKHKQQFMSPVNVQTRMRIRTLAQAAHIHLAWSQL